MSNTPQTQQGTPGTNATLCVVTEYSQTVDVPIGEIWAVLAAFGSERLWMPDCIYSSLEGFGIGAFRTLKFGSTPDIEIRERLEVADPKKHILRFRVFRSDLDGIESYGTAVLGAVSENKTNFTWIGEWALQDEAARLIVKERLDAMYAGFVDSIASKLST